MATRSKSHAADTAETLSKREATEMPRSDYPLSERNDEPFGFGLREALDTVPIFDGSNIPVLQFARTCLRARDIIAPSAERTLTKLILTKLRGRAYAAVEDENPSTVSHLCGRLKDIFGPYRTVDHYRGELASIFMKYTEHILDYISRVKDLRAAILDTTLDDIHPREIDEFVSRCFISGLIPVLRSELRSSRSKKLNDVYDEALHAFKQHELDKERYGERNVKFADVTRPFRRDLSPAVPRDNEYLRSYRNQWAPSPTRDRVIPSTRPVSRDYRPVSPSHNYSQTFRHSPERVDTRAEQPKYRSNIRDNANRAPTINHAESSTPNNQRYCKFCKTGGHDIHECRRRENQNWRSGNDQPLPPTTGNQREGIKQRNPRE